MNEQIAVIKKTREYLLQMIQDLSTDQLNEIPPGFNNNIIWHIGHLLASQQGVCYLRAGMPLAIHEDYYKRYKSDTRPDGFIDRMEVEKITTLFMDAIDQFEYDYEAGIFSNYKPWTTRYGVSLNTIDDAVQFLLFHEGLHTGSVTALKKFVKRMVSLSHNTL